MAQNQNTLIFVDIPSDDTVACAAFYHNVFGWMVEGRPTGVFHRAVPGGFFPLDDGSDSPIGNLHIGFSDVANMRPHPTPESIGPREMATNGRAMRLWVLVGDHDSEDAILDRAEANGAQVLWRHHYWKEFNGFNGAFRDPWGNEILTWTKGGDNPQIPEDYTRE